MEDDAAGQPQAEQADGQRPPAEGSVTDHPSTPSQKKQTGDRFNNAKQIAWRFIGRPVKSLADTLDPYNGLLTALATIALAVLTYFLAVYANDLGVISGRQLTVMQGQLDEMRLEQRPWVRITPVLDKVEVRNDPDSGRELSVWAHLEVENIGKTTAFSVFAYPEAAGSGPTDYVTPEKVKAKCLNGSNAERFFTDQGVTLMPNSPTNLPIRGRVRIKGIGTLTGFQPTTEVWFVTIYGCVSYRQSPTETTWHHTGFAFGVSPHNQGYDKFDLSKFGPITDVKMNPIGASNLVIVD